MSTLVVEVCEVAEVEPHPNADRLAIATIKGWRTCIKFEPETHTPQFEPGDLCVYFPPDTVMPQALAERLGIANYLAPLPKNPDGSRSPGLRVIATRLRGIPSYGVIMATEDPSWYEGQDVAGHYGVSKYEPPMPVDPEGIPSHPSFHRYTEIEHLANYPDILQPGEEVVVTEKIHGKNCRTGLVWVETDPDDDRKWAWMAGSFDLNRRPQRADGEPSEFWQPLNTHLRSVLMHLSAGEHEVVAFGEIFGTGVLDMAYGEQGIGYRLFDIAVNRVYLDYDQKAEVCARFGVPMVPVLYRGPYDPHLIAALTNGPTTLCAPEQAGRFKGREGVVVTPAAERFELNFGNSSGRVILKSVSVDYLARKGGKDAR